VHPGLSPRGRSTRVRRPPSIRLMEATYEGNEIVSQSPDLPPSIGDGALIRKGLRTPRAAGVAGVIFSILLGVALTLVNLASPAQPATVGTWLGETSRRGTVSFALHLVPYAGIAFLWFIGVLRDRIGQREDRFFATVFLGSGLLFVAMLFAASAVAGGLINDSVLRDGPAAGSALLDLGRQVTGLLLNTYAMRMAAVFTLSTATIILRTDALPRWFSFVGFAVGLVLLLSFGVTPWVELLFPGWVLLLSVEILRTGLKDPGRAAAD